MAKVQSLADPGYVITQYKTASNLNARIRLHLQFSTNPYGWQRWLFDQIEFPLQAKILELGCGAGNLWLDNADRIPPDLEFLLSDFSEGMVRQASENLGSQPLFHRFAVIDAQSIPFADRFFDVVIANHMLFHVPDQLRALSEMRRVLQPGGAFYASTAGHSHLRELNELVSRFDPGLADWGKLPAGSFSLEDGAVLLHQVFTRVDLYRYPDALIVTDPVLLAYYILSGRIELSPDRQAALADFISQELRANGGKLYITKDSGLFRASL
jgi:SAM-dependent methyltransferase